MKKVLWKMLGMGMILLPMGMEAGYTVKSWKLVSTNEIPYLSVQEHYGSAMKAYDKKNWSELVHQCNIIVSNFPDTPFAEDGLYYLGVGYYGLRDFEMANKHFTRYLKKFNAPKHFETAIQYKFHIAEKFEFGSRKHLMGFRNMPQWASAKSEAMEIYDEVVTALPNHEISAKALYGKARILVSQDDYKEAVETYQVLIRRFPKTSYAPSSYLKIAKAYLSQVKNEFPDLDILDLAEINMRKYHEDYPSDPNLIECDKQFFSMQEVFASQLYEIGKYYHKVGKLKAAYLYYSKVALKFPKTKTAELAQVRFKKLPPKIIDEMSPKKEEVALSESD